MKRVIWYQCLQLLCVISMVFHFQHAISSDYPSRPIEMVIPFEPGNGTDLIGRLIGELAQEHLGVKIIFNNKPGGAGATAYTYLSNCKADGYTIGMATSTLVSHKIFGNLDFDHNDMDVIILVHSSPSVLCVPTSSKYQSFSDIVNDAKEHPGQVVWGTGSGNHLAGSRDIFNHAGTAFKVIPFSGGGLQPVVQASGGHVDMSFSNYLESKGMIEAGLLRPIAVYAKKRIDQLPDIPTFEELGYPVRCPIVRGVVAPLGVDKTKLDILNSAFKKAVESQRYQDFVKDNAGIVFNVSFLDAIKILDEQREANQEVANHSD